MAILKKRLRASTLIEVVVAMLIAAICFSLAFAILGRLGTQTTGYTRTSAEREVNNLLDQSLLEKNFINDEITFDDFYISKSVENYPAGRDLLQIKVTAFKLNGDTLTESKRLVYEAASK